MGDHHAYYDHRHGKKPKKKSTWLTGGYFCFLWHYPTYEYACIPWKSDCIKTQIKGYKNIFLFVVYSIHSNKKEWKKKIKMTVSTTYTRWWRKKLTHTRYPGAVNTQNTQLFIFVNRHEENVFNFVLWRIQQQTQRE